VFETDRISKLFWRGVVAGPNGCWVRIKVDRNGYSKTRLAGKDALAHRFTYQRLVGPIPKGMQLDHLCRNRACCNPAHLEPVTPKENAARGLKAKRTHCPQGHPLTPDNLVGYALRKGYQDCRKCRNDRQTAKRMEKRNAN